MNTNPFVGQWVDFYPDNHTRLAALVVEVHLPSDSPTFRPNVNLIAFKPDGLSDVWLEVEPVEAQPDEDYPELSEKWGFQHEFMLQQDEGHHDYMGTNTNEHVGEVSVLL